MQSIVLQDTLTLLEVVEGVTSREGPVGTIDNCKISPTCSYSHFLTNLAAMESRNIWIPNIRWWILISLGHMYTNK